MTQPDSEPGYEATDIAEDIQGAIWDRIEAFGGGGGGTYTGMIGDAAMDGEPVITLTDCYGKRWAVTVTAA